jgi:hypothetical protein
MRLGRPIAALALALLALPGCALLQPGADQAVAADGVMAEAVNTARAPLAEQKAALSRAQQAQAADPTALNRLRVATLLATLAPPLRDDAKAAELLEGMTDPGAPGAGRVAALLAVQLAERQRLARELERAARDARERDKREEALRQQLEALRSIERGILEREEKLRGRQR